MRMFTVTFARAHFADVAELTDEVCVWDSAIRGGQRMKRLTALEAEASPLIRQPVSGRGEKRSVLLPRHLYHRI